MTSLYFPPVEEADKDGLLAQGGLFELSLLQDAYINGIFPWPCGEGEPIYWFAPPMRGILFFNELHLPRRFKAWYKKHPYRITFNQAFEQVITEAAHVSRKNQKGTWITKAMMGGYKNLYDAGHILSCEIWEGEQLIAGLYGVYIGGVFSGESMFTHRDNASKLALVEMIYYLQKQGLSWMDTQMTTSVIKSFGGREIPRADYHKLLKTAQQRFLSTL